MKSMRAGQLVTVTDEQGSWDAIVSDTSHLPKVAVAAIGEDGEPAFRETHIGRIKPRHDPGEHDHALKGLISAAGAAQRSGAPGAAGGVTKGRPAHTGPRMHRPTGR